MNHGFIHLEYKEFLTKRETNPNSYQNILIKEYLNSTQYVNIM